MGNWTFSPIFRAFDVCDVKSDAIQFKYALYPLRQLLDLANDKR